TLANVTWQQLSLKAAEELAHAGKHRAAVRILEYWEPKLSSTQQALLGAEREAARTEPLPLDRGDKSDRDWFTARANHISETQVRLKCAFDERELSPMARAAWSAAATDFGEALHLLYDDVEDAIRRSRQGELEAREYLVTFLEADPWCFRSGYLKGRLYELIKTFQLDDRLRERLCGVLLKAVDAGMRTEFRSACRLARPVGEADLVDDLRRRLTGSPDPGTRRRALWMLAYLPDGLRDA